MKIFDYLASKIDGDKPITVSHKKYQEFVNALKWGEQQGIKCKNERGWAYFRGIPVLCELHGTL